MALPTYGRVIIKTTAGEIDIELWSKEAPKTCRNFIALAMEGYYDGVIFHRIVPGFLVQTGDKTGTGAGGESFFGEPFDDEIHPRLRFSHRGLVAAANNGTKNSNDSQFFITLDRADELHGKHTLFGRVMGDTVYNVMKIGETEIDAEGRPTYPPKILSIHVEDNPFDDIVPRITAAEKRAQKRARDEVQRRREEEERRRSAKKNVKLLSFGADEEPTEETDLVQFKKKPIFRTDLVSKQANIPVPEFVTSKPDPPKEVAEAPVDKPKPEKTSKKKDELSIATIRQHHAQAQASSSNARQAEIERMEAEIRKLSRKNDEDSDEEVAKKKPKRSLLQDELTKYSKGRGLYKKGKKRDETGMLAIMESFRSKLKGAALHGVEEEKEDGNEQDKNIDLAADESKAKNTEEDAGMEVDADTEFLGHLLHFPKDNGEETAKAERDYEVIDPRQRGAKAKEEERERRRTQKVKSSGGGRHRR